MNTIQERILQYLEFKGITPYRFCKDLGFSMGYLDKKGAIGTDKYLKIIEMYAIRNNNCDSVIQKANISFGKD